MEVLSSEPLGPRGGLDRAMLNSITASAPCQRLSSPADTRKEQSSSTELACFLDIHNLRSIRNSIATCGARRDPGSDPRFRVVIRQQPRHGLASGDDTALHRSARPIPLDPPLVCELIPKEQGAASAFSLLDLSLRVRLVSIDTPTKEVKLTPNGLEALSGDFDQCAFTAPVYPPQDQSYFMVSELSVRKKGNYRLRIDVIDRSDLLFSVLGSVFSEVFQVHEKATFPGLSPSSDLIRAIARRGLKLRIIKAADSTKALKPGVKKKKRKIEGRGQALYNGDGDEDEMDELKSPTPSSGSCSSGSTGADGLRTFAPTIRVAPPQDNRTRYDCLDSRPTAYPAHTSHLHQRPQPRAHRPHTVSSTQSTSLDSREAEGVSSRAKALSPQLRPSFPSRDGAARLDQAPLLDGAHSTGGPSGHTLPSLQVSGRPRFAASSQPTRHSRERSMPAADPRRALATAVAVHQPSHSRTVPISPPAKAPPSDRPGLEDDGVSGFERESDYYRRLDLLRRSHGQGQGQGQTREVCRPDCLTQAYNSATSSSALPLFASIKSRPTCWVAGHSSAPVTPFTRSGDKSSPSLLPHGPISKSASAMAGLNHLAASASTITASRAYTNGLTAQTGRLPTPSAPEKSTSISASSKKLPSIQHIFEAADAGQREQLQHHPDVALAPPRLRDFRPYMVHEPPPSSSRPVARSQRRQDNTSYASHSH